MENNVEFPNGIMFKLPHEKAPDFVKGSISIKLDEAIEYLQAKKATGEQWINLDAKVSKNTGKGYLQLNTWKKDNQTPQAPKETGTPVQSQPAEADEIPY